MNDDENLKSRLQQYRAPDAPNDLEGRLWAAIERLPLSEPVHRGLWWFGVYNWQLTGFAAALSVFVAHAVGQWMGSGSALPMADVMSGLGGLL